MSDARFAQLPAVHALVDAAATDGIPRWAVVEAARRAIADRRALLQRDATATPAIEPRDVGRVAAELARPHLRRVINATGVVLHTNFGRAPLARAAIDAIAAAAAGYTNLEYDLAAGARGSRHDHLRDLLRDVTGAEDAIVVNNNAAATLLGLAALATDREIIVSRGELIEIGGSFRLPEVLALSRGILVEVGTTNKTHAKDYERAITDRTGLLLKVHRSNFAIIGFTAEVDVPALVAIGKAVPPSIGRTTIPTMVDVGSGALITRETQRAWGLPDEPTVREVVAAGADLVTFSGDKLVGGPQAGILVGTRDAIARAKQHPLMRALRPDKLAIAGLAATLSLYRDGTPELVPIVAMISRSSHDLEAIARALAARIPNAAVAPCISTVGGGAMPTAQLASWAVTIDPSFEEPLRSAAIPVIGRISDGKLWLDVRTITVDEVETIVSSVSTAASYV